MRSQVLIAATLSVMSGMVVGPVAPAVAQLQWQSSGVQQVAHTHSEPTARAEQTKPVRRAKAPTVRRVATQQPSTRAGSVHQAKAVVPVVMAAPVIEANQGLRYDGAVAPACHQCGNGACGCGETYYEEEPTCGLTYGESCGCGDIGCAGECGMACGEVCGCGDVCSCGVRSLGGCSDRGAVPLILYIPPIQELTIFGGVHAFKGPLDEGRDRGNFGVHEGFNIGGRMAWLPIKTLGYQIGYQATHSQLHGDSTLPTSDHHTQQFVTAGLFHRKPVGLQYGVAYDLLRDERQGSADFSQIRGLISITNPCGHEFGFTFASSVNDSVINQTLYQSVDQYLLFYRKHGPQGGELRFYGGFDNDSKGILGGEVSVPLDNRWSLETGFTYLIPEEDTAGVGSAEEAWNLGTNLVWHYGKRAKRAYGGQFRPMFGVADNGSLMVDDVP